MREIKTGMITRQVLFKQNNLDLQKSGAFGNATRNWFGYQDMREALNDNDLVAIRNLQPNSPYCMYDVKVGLVYRVLNEFITQGVKLDDVYFTEGTDDNTIILQGEVCRTYRGLDLTYSVLKDKMRIALAKETRWATGLSASFILQSYMDASSWECLSDLLDVYDDHVIEFSVYTKRLGTLHWNTIFWEVRNY